MRSALFLIVLIFMNPVIADDLSDSNSIFDFLESNHPQSYSPSNVDTSTINGFLVRYYENTNSYLGTKEGRVYSYSEESGGLKDLGSIEELLMYVQESTRPDPKSICYTFKDSRQVTRCYPERLVQEYCDAHNNGHEICNLL